MKKLLPILISVLVLGAFVFIKTESKNEDSKASKVKAKYQAHLDNSPFKDVILLSKKERKARGLSPNKYYEREWELTMNPEIGRPTPENLPEIKRERLEALANGRVPGDAMDNGWDERGPNNVGGRTRAIMFDPNDATNETVFAGGVSGGLWKNTNISNSASSWTRVNIPDNLNVTTITVDPNNSNIFYVGTGESYVGGAVNGNGVWKSTDAGLTWANILGGINGATTFEYASNVTVNSPAGIAGEYPCYPTTAFGPAITSTITANIELVNDGTAAPTEGCNTLTNSAASMNGKIALIRRGNCTFVQKIKNAQDKGAAAVIMMNNVAGTPIPMGGDDPTITIPSVMISQDDGDILEAAVQSGTVNASLNPSAGGFTGLLVPGIQHINDIKVRNNGGNSEIYVAAGDSFYGGASTATYLGGTAFGIYKSVDGGANWTEVSLPLTTNNNKRCPNDIEIGSDGRIWVSTIHSTVFGDGGGEIFVSTDGSTFTRKHRMANTDRTQIAISSTDPNKLYVLAEGDATTPVVVKVTTNEFCSWFCNYFNPSK